MFHRIGGEAREIVRKFHLGDGQWKSRCLLVLSDGYTLWVNMDASWVSPLHGDHGHFNRKERRYILRNLP